MWIPLEGKLAQACHSKLHLRIFLNNTRGSNVAKEYITKMEKEVGKKVDNHTILEILLVNRLMFSLSIVVFSCY